MSGVLLELAVIADGQLDADPDEMEGKELTLLHPGGEKQ